MQFKVALVSLFAALAIASPLEKRCTANGGSCTQLSQCCSGNCEYDSSIGLVCKAASKKREVEEPALEKRCSANGVSCDFNNAECCSGNCEYSIGDSNAYCRATSKKREAEPEALLEKRCSANGVTCNFNNAECCSGNCEYSIGDSNAYCRATSKKREASPEPVPEALLEKRCSANGVTCNFNNAECCSGNCEYSIGDSNAYCRATSKKREASPEPVPEALLEKRCTSNGGSCTQLSQCCSGNCEYDSSIGLVCKAASKKREAEPVPETLLEKRCTANGGSCTQLSQCCSGNCEYDSSVGLVCKA